ncbi:hypothetical protein [Acidocella sp.]|uniref:hypothetical protein n=1 Tax=Acidocella sp. TaxID=50710 RepID=UPI0026049710|nr:hypothetical protein [Acidocella sp.]
MRSALLPLSLLALLAACAPIGRQDFAPAPVAPDTADLAAPEAFSGRIALFTIGADAGDVAAPVKAGVSRALKIKPDASFEVRATCPAGLAPDAAAACLSGLGAEAGMVADDIEAAGVPASRLLLTARAEGDTQQILVFVK